MLVLLWHKRLAQEGATVVGTGRQIKRVNWLADFGVVLAQADLRDESALSPLLANQDVVFHVAAWLSGRHGDHEQARQINVTVPANLLRWSAKQANGNLSRFVHVSSIAVYGVPNERYMTEEQPLDTWQRNLYGRTKADGEWACRQVAQELKHPVYYRPPRHDIWTPFLCVDIAPTLPHSKAHANHHWRWFWTCVPCLYRQSHRWLTLTWQP